MSTKKSQIIAVAIFGLVLITVTMLTLSKGQTKSHNAEKTMSPQTTTSPTSSGIIDQTSSAIPLERPLSFHDQVEQICNSVDPQIFIDLLQTNPSVDNTYQTKFSTATTELNKLKDSFQKVTPPTSPEAWQKGLDNLDKLSESISTVKKQYDEFLNLEDEKKTTTDLARSIEIANRQIQLVSEYTATLSSIQTLYTELISIGSSAGIARCKALAI